MQSAVFFVVLKTLKGANMPVGPGKMLIDLDKEHLAAMMEAGYIYVGMRRYKEAKELFEGLCSIAPESELPFVALGNVEFCQGNLSLAVANYKKAIRIDPNSMFAKVYLGEALYFSGKEAEAIKLLKEVSQCDEGGAGEFAVALLSAIEKGFKPEAKK